VVPITSQPIGALTLRAAPASEEDWQLSDEALASLPDVVPITAAPPPLGTAPNNEDDWLFWHLPAEALASSP
jgi:hypothetical protein